MFGWALFEYGPRPLATGIHHTQMSEVGVGPYDSCSRTLMLSTNGVVTLFIESDPDSPPFYASNTRAFSIPFCSTRERVGLGPIRDGHYSARGPRPSVRYRVGRIAASPSTHTLAQGSGKDCVYPNFGGCSPDQPGCNVHVGAWSCRHCVCAGVFWPRRNLGDPGSQTVATTVVLEPETTPNNVLHLAIRWFDFWNDGGRGTPTKRHTTPIPCCRCFITPPWRFKTGGTTIAVLALGR